MTTQRALTLATRIFTDHGQWLHDGTPWHYAKEAAADIEAAFQQVERETLERAVMVGVTVPSTAVECDVMGAILNYDRAFRDAIRALIDMPPTELDSIALELAKETP